MYNGVITLELILDQEQAKQINPWRLKKNRKKRNTS